MVDISVLSVLGANSHMFEQFVHYTLHFAGDSPARKAAETPRVSPWTDTFTHDREYSVPSHRASCLHEEAE